MEVLLAIATLAMVAAAVTLTYSSGFQSLNSQTDDLWVHSQLRSHMEEIVSTPFAALTNGVRTVSVAHHGVTNTLNIVWTTTPVDMDGDNMPDPGAVLITSTADGVSLNLLQVNHEGQVQKL